MTGAISDRITTFTFRIASCFRAVRSDFFSMDCSPSKQFKVILYFYTVFSESVKLVYSLTVLLLQDFALNFQSIRSN